MRTLREVFIKVLIDIKKEESPNLHLREFNELINETVSEFVASVYFAFETTQKSLDFCRPLKKYLNVVDFEEGDFPLSSKFTVPQDYRHVTGIEVYFKGKKNKCSDEKEVYYSAKRIEPDKRSWITSDPYQKPMYRQPYWSLHEDLMHIYTGESEKYTISKVLLEYLKEPDRLELTYEQAFVIDEDTSQVLEFNAEGCDKIKDMLVLKMFEREQNPRMNSYSQIQQIQPLPELLGNTNQSNTLQ